MSAFDEPATRMERWRWRWRSMLAAREEEEEEEEERLLLLLDGGIIGGRVTERSEGEEADA